MGRESTKAVRNLRSARIAAPLCLLMGCTADPSVVGEATPPPQVGSIPSADQGVLLVSPNPVDLGVLRPGQSAEATITLRNSTDEDVAIDRVELSCACVRLDNVPHEIAPSASVTIKLHFEPPSAPDFRGELELVAVGFGRGVTDELFHLLTRLRVAAP